MIYHLIFNNSNTTGSNIGAGTAYPFEAREFTPGLLARFVLLNI
jgi:hypothetical protein